MFYKIIELNAVTACQIVFAEAFYLFLRDSPHSYEEIPACMASEHWANPSVTQCSVGWYIDRNLSRLLKVTVYQGNNFVGANI